MPRRTNLGFLFLLLLYLSRAASGSPMPPMSLGCSVFDSTYVVRGQIIAVDPPDPGAKRADCKITVKVLEQFRGDPVDTLTFNADNFDWVDNWKQIRPEQLFCIVTMTDGTLHPWPFIKPFELEGGRLKYTIFADDLRLLTQRDEVLEEARALAKMTPVTWVEVPTPTYLQKATSDDRATIAVDFESLAAAKQWIHSPELVRRWAAAEILLHDKSPENMQALRTFALENQPFGYQYGPHSRVKLLTTLQNWGTPNVPPIILSSSPFFAYSTWAAWASILGIVLPPTFYVALKRRKTSLPILWWATLGFILVLAIRSYSPRDAVTWGNWDVVIERGRVHVMHHPRATRYPVPSPLVVCRPDELLPYEGDFDWSMLLSNDLHEPIGHMNGLFRPVHFTQITSPIDPADWPKQLYIRGSTTPGYPPNPVFAFSIWLLLAALSPYPLWLSWRWFRAWRSRRRPGFPVLPSPPIANSPPPL